MTKCYVNQPLALSVVCLFSLVSCTTNSLRKTPQLAQSLKNFCFNAEGKGRIHFYKERYLFNYESLQSEIGSWSFAFELPGMGEELMKLDYSKADVNGTQLSGSFYRRLLAQKQQSQADRIFKLHMAIDIVGSFLLLVDKAQTQTLQSNCVSTEKKGHFVCRSMSGEQGLLVVADSQLSGTWRLGTDHFVHIKLLQAEGKWRDIQVMLRREGQSGPDSLLFQLKLFPSKCKS